MNNYIECIFCPTMPCGIKPASHRLPLLKKIFSEKLSFPKPHDHFYINNTTMDASGDYSPLWKLYDFQEALQTIAWASLQWRGNCEANENQRHVPLHRIFSPKETRSEQTLPVWQVKNKKRKKWKAGRENPLRIKWSSEKTWHTLKTLASWTHRILFQCWCSQQGSSFRRIGEL